jgi:hypothetical protein
MMRARRVLDRSDCKKCFHYVLNGCKNPDFVGWGDYRDGKCFVSLDTYKEDDIEWIAEKR